MHQRDAEGRVIDAEPDEGDGERQGEDRDRKGAGHQDQHAVGSRAPEAEAGERVTGRHAERERHDHGHSRGLDADPGRTPHAFDGQEGPQRLERDAEGRKGLWPLRDDVTPAERTKRQKIDRQQRPDAEHQDADEQQGAVGAGDAGTHVRCSAGTRKATR